MMTPGRQVPLHTLASGAGWAAKMGPEALAQVLQPLTTLLGTPPHDLLVGLGAADDAAVYRLNAEQAVVATLDFFPPVVDDATTFGAVAAANALSDVYAMGGEPLFCL